MSSMLQSLRALPFDRLQRHPDLVLTMAVGMVIATMIIPLPSQLLDGLLAVNLTASALILISALLADRALSMSSFPTLLLLTTLLRLALNVSTTRLILSTGSGGHVVETFGKLVMGDDVFVGLVIFLALTMVQLLVVGKGAERVAEVGARFTLDALPGKQLAIDGAVRAGALTEEAAQERREELNREAQFYGAMDGAMKFVKGDALAGLVITALNLVAGMLIGVLRHEMALTEAIDRYGLLSIGDALVAQLPSLLITLAAGVVTTRVAARDRRTDLGALLQSELFSNPKALAVGGAFSFALALVPGLPALPFCAIGVALAAGAQRRLARERTARVEASRELAVHVEARARQTRAQRSAIDQLAPSVLPISIEVGCALSDALGLEESREEESELVEYYLRETREALYSETGVHFPTIRVRAGVARLRGDAFVLRLREIPVLEERVDPGRGLAVEPPERLLRLGVHALPMPHPMTGVGVASVPLAALPALHAANVAVWSPGGIIALFVARALREHARDFVGLQETSEMVERLEQAYPALVKEVVPKLLSLGQLAEILRRLVDEGVSIRDLKGVFEALAQFAPHECDSVQLTEQVRSALSLQLAFAHAGSSGRIQAVLLDPLIEDTIRGAITHTSGGSYLALAPEIRSAIIEAFLRGLEPIRSQGVRPVVLTTVEIRRYVHTLIEEDVPGVAVLSFQELPPKLLIQPHGRIHLEEEHDPPALRMR